MKYLIILLISIIFSNELIAQGCRVDATVRKKDNGQPLPNVSLEVDSYNYKTNKDGQVYFFTTKEKNVIKIKHLGFKSQEINILCVENTFITIDLVAEVQELDSIYISTGYERISKERATGSFEYIDNKLLNRTVGMNILSRLENITTGIHFDKQSISSISLGLPITPKISLHGISTLRDYSNRSSPLIILDNFPYDGDINTINPNDIESITILKDAAATSIWGAKAGNGVIVLTSKVAKSSDRIRGTFSSNITMHTKPNLMKHQVINPADYIEIERFLFDKGFYRNMEINRSRPALSPAVELFINERDNIISTEKFNKSLATLKSQDIREDFNKYLYRNSTIRQHNISLNGQSNKHRFILSANYDNSLPTQKGRKYDRANVRLDNNYQPHEKLNFSTSIRWAISRELMSDGVPIYSDLGYKYPYMKLADSLGRPLPIPKDYRLSYIENTGEGRLMDWLYKPLDEILNPPTKSIQKDLYINTGITYQLFPWLTLDIKYQYADNFNHLNSLYNLSNYRTRNQINLGSKITDGNIVYNFPFGSIIQEDYNTGIGHNGRFQTNINKSWQDEHQFNSVLGFEFNSKHTSSNGFTVIGLDENTLIFPTIIDYLTPYPIYDNLQASGTIGQPLRPMTDLHQRYVSYYGNASYSYLSRYIFSASFRKDASNLFGLSTNDKWSPLWSVGGKWNIAKESFLNEQWLSKLDIRGSYGFSGNVDNSLSAVPTLRFLSSGSPYMVPWQGAQILNAPNSELRWEKVKTITIGLDFGFLNGLLSGSIDYYNKNTKDIYTNVPLDPTTGLDGMVINGANINGKGLDFQIKVRPINSTVKWNTNLLFSYNNTWIKRNYKEYTGPNDLLTGGINSIEGHLAFPMYSYKWGGLDPQTGEPRGVLNGEPSKDYRSLRNKDIQPSDLVFHGSRRPVYWGAVRNDVQFRNWAISANISWKAGYYFRKESINYAQVLNNGYTHADYYNRWQKPGDEEFTDVPAFLYPLNSLANSFYANSEVLVEKGDHIFLDNIRLDYRTSNLKFIDLTTFLIMSNVGTIWSASKSGQFPDNATSIPMPRSLSFGFNINF